MVWCNGLVSATFASKSLELKFFVYPLEKVEANPDFVTDVTELQNAIPITPVAQCVL